LYYVNLILEKTYLNCLVTIKTSSTHVKNLSKM